MHALICGATTPHHKPIEETLQTHGYAVLHAEKPDEAWAVYQEAQPLLVVLTDIGAESLVLARRIRTGEHGEAVILLAMVHPDAEDYLQGILEAEVDDCVSGQADSTYLKARLSLAARRSQRRIRRHQIEAELAVRLRQQATVAELGRRALIGMPWQALMGEAVSITARALDVEFCKVLEYLPDEEAFLLRAGVGWKEGLVGHARVEAGHDSQAGFTFHVGEPVVVDDLVTETRFNGPPLLTEHGVVSGISIILMVEGEPYGVLGVHTARQRAFQQDDVNFLQAVANVLAEAVEHDRFKEKLLRERNFVSAVLNTAGALVVVLDAEGRIVRFNRACEQTTGYTFEEIQGRTVWDFLLMPEEKAGVEGVFDELRGGASNEHENDWVTKQGERRRIAWANTVLADEAGAVEYVIGTGIDITEQVQARQALQESEAHNRAILDTTVDGIITIDEQGIIESFNTAAERIFGYQAGEIIGRSINMLMPVPYSEEHDSYIQNYIETGHRKIIGIGREVVGLRKDGSIFPMDLAVSELNLEDRRIFTGIIRDISERRSLEQEILRISEQERRRIGQDLHDGLGQMLTGIGLITKNLARSLEHQDHPGADEVTEVTELIKEADQHARILARGLMPVDLEATGLAAALRRLTVNAGRLFGIQCTFEEVGEVLIDDNSIATHLYRIAQEAVSNAVKHGRAGHVKISLATGRQIRLRIHDDGVGFRETIDEERRGMGVRIMHYRARVIGAPLDITDGHDGGTTITCTLRRADEPIHLPEDLAV